MNNIWIVVTAKGEIASLVEFLKLTPANVTALVVGSRELAEEASCEVSDVKWIDSKNAPVENYTYAAADALMTGSQAVAIGASSPGTRAILGIAATKSSMPVASNVIEVSSAGDTVCVKRSVLGDKLIETIKMPVNSCLLVSALNLQPVVLSATARSEIIEEIKVPCESAVEYVSVDPATVSSLKSADYIVGIGLGASDSKLFGQSMRLAEVMGAEIGCSMPVYSELQLLPHENYIGLTGHSVSPKLYLALGISGTSHHRAGVRNAGTIVCINKDPNALFFSDADYGIVGDLNEVLPLLISELKN